MKKLALYVMTASMLLLFSSAQSKAATETNPASTTATTIVKAEEPNTEVVRLNEIKAIDVSALSSSDKKELLKEDLTIKNDQDRHGRRGYGRRNRGNVDVTVRSDGRRNYDGYHNHSGAYIGGGGVLILILILILIL